jgi:hypothetical protein
LNGKIRISLTVEWKNKNLSDRNGKIRISLTVEWKNKNISDC